MKYNDCFMGNNGKRILPIPDDMVDDFVKIPFIEQPKPKSKVHLENIIIRNEIYKISNIYFIRDIEYEYNDESLFQLTVHHFEDGFTTVDTYRLNKKDSIKFKTKFPDHNSIKNKFGYENGDDLFCKYCKRHNMSVKKSSWI